VQYILKKIYISQQIWEKGSLIGTATYPIIDTDGKWKHMSKCEGAFPYDDYTGKWLYTISAIEIFPDGSTKNVSSFNLNGIECATFGHGHLDKDVSDPEYSALSSTFWGKTILSVFDQLKEKRELKKGVLELDRNFSFFREEKKLCIEINDIKY